MDKGEKIYTEGVNVMPEFVGGLDALLEYMRKIPYPAMAKENNIEGRVFIKFVVNEIGKVTDIEVKRGADKILNYAALNHVKAMPQWIPGKHNNKPVKVQFVIPVKFNLTQQIDK